MSEPKTCKKCGIKLSSYNPGPYCFAHTDGMPVKTHYPVTKCGNPIIHASHDRHPYASGWMVNLNELANKRSFTESVTGVVIDGKTEPIEKVINLN